jgi:hypothetical protein
MLRQLVSLATCRLLLRVAGTVACGFNGTLYRGVVKAAHVRFGSKADSCTATNSRLDHLVVGAGNQRTLALQWRIDDRKALLVLLEGDVGDAKRFAQLVVRHFHWAR